MSKVTKILALSLILTIIMIVSIAGTVFAGDGNPEKGNGNLGLECPYGECVSGDCVPNDYSYYWNYSYASPGPHGAQKGNPTE